MLHRRLTLAGLLATAGLAIAAEPILDIPALEAELRATEAAFAQTMADRDHSAFASFIAPDAVFFGGGQPLRGREAIAAGWARFFANPAAPFAWAPSDVFVTAAGDLGLSSGPVFDPDGTQVSFFTSTWRRGGDGRWRIVLDRGCPPCE